jgi:ketosteroid isomerase-like protein
MRQSLMPTSENLDIVRRYLKSVENGAFSDVAPLVTPDVVMEQLPNRIYPQGLRATISQMAAAFEKGRKLLSSQTYEIKNAVINGDSIAVEVLWTGTLAVGFGTLTAGSQMRCHSSMFFEFKNGKICSQRNYDCFEPW